MFWAEIHSRISKARSRYCFVDLIALAWGDEKISVDIRDGVNMIFFKVYCKESAHILNGPTTQPFCQTPPAPSVAIFRSHMGHVI